MTIKDEIIEGDDPVDIVSGNSVVSYEQVSLSLPYPLSFSVPLPPLLSQSFSVSTWLLLPLSILSLPYPLSFFVPLLPIFVRASTWTLTHSLFHS